MLNIFELIDDSVSTFRWLVGVCAAIGFTLMPPVGLAVEHKPAFDREIRPILAAKCMHCHGPDAKTRHADLRLDDSRSLSRVAKKNTQGISEILVRIRAQDDDLKMPPPDSKIVLTKQEIESISSWIESGAGYQAHWSFVSQKRPTLPAAVFFPGDGGNVRSAAVENSIDRFVQQRLSQENLQPASPAEPATLIRRVTLDLTGLPPDLREVSAFVADDSPGAYELLVDRLLNSPRYGEHMAATWLDAARYADTDGYQNDRLRYQHAWRDWVVMALNENLPYDQFIIEQIAGDLLPKATLKQQIATGFGRNHRINSEDGSIPNEWHVEYVADRVDTIGTVFMGLTIGCARCHEHKYDPITQKEYYRLFAYFNNVPEWGVGPNNGNSPPFIDVPENWQSLSPGNDQPVTPEPVVLRQARQEAGNGLRRPQPGGPSTVMVMHELPQPRPTYMLLRGRYDAPDRSEQLAPGIPASLGSANAAGTQRNRLDLARWLVQPDHPLTARVAVNRIWQHFFGTGLVKTSENFGAQGDRPSHPELLDWLAVEFVESQWDIKSLQRMIVLSATYRQRSATNATAMEQDPENRLLARGPRLRLSAFAMRDCALTAAGLLAEQIGGPPVKPYMPADIWSSISNNKYEQGTGVDLYRRSLYTYWRRTIPPPTMINFNSATREFCSVRNDRTNTPLQALTLMNNVVFVESARMLAERTLREIPSPSVESQIRFAFASITARQLRVQELDLLREAALSFRQHFQTSSEAAEQLLSMGEHPRDNSLASVELATLTMVCSLILNLDEAITKE